MASASLTYAQNLRHVDLMCTGVKCLLHKHEDLSLDTPTPTCVWNPSAPRWADKSRGFLFPLFISMFWSQKLGHIFLKTSFPSFCIWLIDYTHGTVSRVSLFHNVLYVAGGRSLICFNLVKFTS